LRESKKSSVNDYLESASQQISSLSRSPIILSGMIKLNDAYKITASDKQIGGSLSSHREDVADYYRNNFISKLKEVDPDSKVSAGSLVGSLSANALELQHAYIRDNQNPVGKSTCWILLAGWWHMTQLIKMFTHF